MLINSLADSPYRTFSGPVGGIRSELEVDANHLRPYYYATMLCMNQTAWENAEDVAAVASAIRLIDFSTIEDQFRGFSDALRVGRFAYVTPLNSGEGVYSSHMIRINLGEVDIGTTLTELGGGDIRAVIDILDLAKISESMRGFSSLFTSGQYLFLVPFRNTYEPRNGQRGHGTLVRLNMNDFDVTGIDFIDLPTTTRTQIPSFADVNLRGYISGFASESFSTHLFFAFCMLFTNHSIYSLSHV